MELFYAELSPYARKVRVVMNEKGIAGKVKMTSPDTSGPITFQEKRAPAPEDE